MVSRASFQSIGNHCVISDNYLVLPFRLIILSIILLLFEYDKSIECIELLWGYIVGYICLLFGECHVSPTETCIDPKQKTFFN